MATKKRCTEAWLKKVHNTVSDKSVGVSTTVFDSTWTTKGIDLENGFPTTGALAFLCRFGAFITNE